MRQVTLLDLANIQDPIVREALKELMSASADNIINDVGESGAALSTITDAAADEIAYYAGPTDVQLTAFTAFGRSLVALTSLAGLGGLGLLQSANNLSDVSSVSTSRTNLGLGTGDSPQFTAVNIGHASDTTVTRTGAGDIAVEGNAVYRAGGTDVPVTDGGTGSSTASGARTNLGLVIGTDVLAYDAQLTSNIRQNTQNATYTTVLTDGEKHLYHSSGSAHTWTIDSNANVAYPIGTAITFVNVGAGVVTLAITSDTLTWCPPGSTGSRSLAQYSVATALKVDTTSWVLTGVGIT